MNIFKQKLARCNAKNEHYKMYKVGRKWLFASASVLAMSQFLLVGTAKADTADATATDTPTTTQVTTANTAATSSAATLKTAPTTKTVPTTDTVKANAGEKENNQTQTDTKNAATKQNNAQQTPAATTGDKVTTAVKPSATQQPTRTDSQKAPVKTAPATGNQPVTTADSTQKSAPKTAVTATDPKVVATTTATQVNSKTTDTTDTTQKASTPNNQKTSQVVSAPDQAQQVKLPAGTKISVDAAGTTVYALPVNADLKAAQAAIAASGIKGPVEITVAADQISVNVNTSTYYYGDTPAQNAAQKGTDKPFYSGNVGDTIDTSKLGTTDADLKAAFADPSDPKGVYTVQVGTDPQLYNSLTAAIAANPKLAAGDIKVVYYSGAHFGYHDDQGQVQFLDKNIIPLTKGWLITQPSSLVNTVNNAPAGKIDMTAFNSALNRVKQSANATLNSRKTAMATAQAYMNSLASFKDGQVNADLVKSQDEPIGANPESYQGQNTSTGNSFKQEMTLYETQLQAVKTFLNSYTADSQKANATGAASQGTAELQNALAPISRTLADLASGMTQTDPYVSEPYVGPQNDGLGANPTLYDAMNAIGGGALGTTLTSDQAAQVSALITSLNNAANGRDTAAAAVGAVSGIDATLPTPEDAAQTANKKAVTDALKTVNTVLTDAQGSNSYDPNADGDDNNAAVVFYMKDLAQAVNAATYPYSLEPTVAPLKADLDAQIAKTKTPDDLAALNTAMTNLTAALTAANDKVGNDRTATNAQAQAILNALGAATVTLPASTTTAEQALQTAVTKAAADKGTTQEIKDAMNITIPVVQNIKNQLATGSTLPAGKTLPADSTRTITFTVTATPDKAGETDPSKYTVSYVPETPIASITPTKFDGFTGAVTNEGAVPANFDPTKETLNDATVTYTAEPSKITITYTDTDNDGATVGTDGPLSGTNGQSVTYSIPNGYELDGNPNLPTTFGIGQATNYTVKLKHKKVNAAPVTTTRTINVVQNAGDPTAPALPSGQTQKVTWTSVYDQVTKATTYTPSGNYDEIDPMPVAGYTVTVNGNATSITNTSTQTKPTDPTAVTITYTANPQSVTINYVDETGNAVGTATISGTTGSTTPYTLTAPNKYDLLTGQATTGNYTFKANGNTPITVTVSDHHDMGTMTTTATINQTGLPTAATTPVTVTWNTDTDQVTGKTTYTPASDLTVDSPTVEGYTPATNTVTVSTPTDGTKPTDQTINLAYTPATQTNTINYVDGSGKVVGTATITGKTGSSTPYTLTAPNKYDLPTGQATTGNYTFKAKDNTPITVTVSDHHDKGTMTTTATINQTGLPTAATKPVTVTWNTDTDQVTGKTTYTPASDLTVNSPKVDGYTPATNTVTVPTPTTGTKPTDQTIDLNYTPNVQTTTINYVDGTGKVIGTTTISGTTDNSTPYTLTVPANYDLSPNQEPTGSYFFEASGNTPITIHIQDHYDIVGATKTTRTIKYQLASGTTLAPGLTMPTSDVQTITYMVERSEVTGENVYTPYGGYAKVDIPTLQGYTASQTGTIPEDWPMVSGDKPKDAAPITITYTGKSVTAPDTLTIPSNKGNQTPAPGTVTGKTGDHINVNVPTVTGYTPDKTTVPATVNANGTITLDGPSAKTGDKGYVTYTANPQSIQVNFVDQDGKAIGGENGTVTLSGVSDGAVDYTPVFKEQQALLNQGYTVTKDSNKGKHGLDTATKTFTDYGEVPTYTVQLTTPQPVSKEQVNTDVPTANEYTVNYMTPIGTVAGSTTVDGNPGSSFDLTKKVPNGFVLTPGQKTIEVTIPKGQDPTKPLTFNVTWPAGQVGAPQQSRAKTNPDEPSANQYTINFTTPDGRVVGTTTVVGNPGSNFDVTNKVPNGFVPVTANDDKGTIAANQDSKNPIVVNVKSPTSTDTQHDTGQPVGPANPTNTTQPTAGPGSDIKSNGTQPGAAVIAQPGKTTKGESTGSQPGVAVKPKKKNVDSSPVSTQGKSNPSNNGETTALNAGEAVSGKSAAGQGTADAYAVTTANGSSQAAVQGQQAAAQQTVAQSQQQAAAQSQGQTQVNGNNQGQNQSANKGQLPQTNESQSSVMATIGLGLLSLLSVFGLGKKRRKSDDQ
ncbi:KxYKxGKxW signal peptide domain-containing protein [Secundilactobacillus silagei]|uniref:Gram positive anchor domain protein n=2 Tax=Secundilactobacillus silagei TaxID=1293415 RepID=A0A1Z5IHA1_9LACO|nr:KxYKxGKxW signal peptide domain-containing protein [Secundilactobacillus silagei]TDG69336.1 hypothetical protein C5L25_000267 [Secundilactobacillus silagei JCM 19001]GAX01059.1 gram positive anchor domain protein [Secundilactobacillus silagei JCM 19001]